MNKKRIKKMKKVVWNKMTMLPVSLIMKRRIIQLKMIRIKKWMREKK